MTEDVLPDYPFRRAMHDRMSERRTDEVFLDKAWSDERSRVLVLRGTNLAASDDGTSLTFIPPADAPDGERLLLGEVQGTVFFALMPSPQREGPIGEFDDIQVSIQAGEGPSTTLTFVPLRRLAMRLSPVEASLAVHAAALVGWHLRHPRCSVCGERTVVSHGGELRSCPRCGATHFPRTDPAVIMTVIDDAGRCLLGHNVARKDGWYSTLAGFVEPGESPEEAVVREVAEEVGVRIDRVTYLGSQPWPFPSSLMLGFEAHASTEAIDVDGEEITDARWFSRDELRRTVGVGEVGLPTTISIAGALLTRWYGEDLPPNVLEL